MDNDYRLTLVTSQYLMAVMFRSVSAIRYLEPTKITCYVINLMYVVILLFSFYLCSFLAFPETNLPYHPCLFFVKVEVGRKKKAEDVSDVKLLLFGADGVDAC